jgi:hypothetical protein
MRHVVDKIIFDLCQLLLAQHSTNGKIERRKDNNGECNGSGNSPLKGSVNKTFDIRDYNNQHFTGTEIFTGRSA